MENKMFYEYMQRLLDIKFNVEAIKNITDLVIKGLNAIQDEERERLLQCYYLYLTYIEMELQSCISDIDKDLIKDKGK